MSIGKRIFSLFSSGSKATPEPESYKGFGIEADPIREGSYFRTAGYISAARDGEPRRVRFIRADQHTDRDAAIQHALSKARQIIDEQGDSLLDKDIL